MFRKKPKKILIKPRGDVSPPPNPPRHFHRKRTIGLPDIELFFRKNKRWVFLGAGFILSVFLGKWMFGGSSKAVEPSVEAALSPADSLPVQADIDLSAYNMEKDVFRENTPLTTFLRKKELKDGVIASLLSQGKKVGLTMLAKGHEMRMFTPKEPKRGYRFFIYEKSPDTLIYIHPFPMPQLAVHSRPLEKKTASAGIVVKTTLWDAVYDSHISPKIIEQMEEAMKWSVDFYHLEPGDKFKVIYEEIMAGDEVSAVGQLRAVYFDTRQGEHYAFFVEEMAQLGFLDEFGRSVRRSFLKSPVKYGRVSSSYNPERIHPVLHEKRPHLGTDYAAPKGDPIFAVSDGIVEEAKSTSNNGNYVKIRHDKVYETQYLHMNNFAEGIKKGKRVAQGQVIGYVGETGLATGPHVCFRFWKNAKQVDHLKENINRTSAMNVREEDLFLSKKAVFTEQLRAVTYSGKN